jgi:hypothetical protein
MRGRWLKSWQNIRVKNYGLSCPQTKSQNIQSSPLRRPLLVNSKIELNPSLLVILNNQSTSHDSKIKTIKIIGQMRGESQLVKFFLDGGISSLRRLLTHNFHSIQEEAAFCLFELTSINEDQNLSLPRTVSFPGLIDSSPSAPFGMIFSQSDYCTLLHPLLNRLICDHKKIESTITTSMAIFTILSKYPSLSDELLRINVVERLLPLLRSPLLTVEKEGGKEIHLLLNILKIFAILTKSKLFPNYCPNLFIRSVKEILTKSTASICAMKEGEMKDFETEVRLHAAISLENITHHQDLYMILHEEHILQSMAQIYAIWPKPTLLRGVREMLHNPKSSTTLFDEGAFDIILRTLLGGDVQSCELICQELRSRLSTETKKRNSLLLEIVSSDEWLKTLTNNLEFGSDAERQFILESLINIANSRRSRQKLLLSHGTVVVALRLLKNCLKTVRNKGYLELQEITIDGVPCQVALMRSLSLLIGIIAEHIDSHGYIYILGGADLMMDIFLDFDLDFQLRKHAAITLAQFVSNADLESHIKDIYPNPITPSFPCSIVEENFDCLTLSDIVAGDQKNPLLGPQTNNVDQGIAVVLKAFLENDVYPWK